MSEHFKTGILTIDGQLNVEMNVWLPRTRRWEYILASDVAPTVVISFSNLIVVIRVTVNFIRFIRPNSTLSTTRTAGTLYITSVLVAEDTGAEEVSSFEHTSEEGSSEGYLISLRLQLDSVSHQGHQSISQRWQQQQQQLQGPQQPQ